MTGTSFRSLIVDSDHRGARGRRNCLAMCAGPTVRDRDTHSSGAARNTPPPGGLAGLGSDPAFVNGEGADVHTDQPAAELRAERERVLDGPVPLDGKAGRCFRTEIMSSWRRCKLVGITPTGEDLPYPPGVERAKPVVPAAGRGLGRPHPPPQGGPGPGPA